MKRSTIKRSTHAMQPYRALCAFLLLALLIAACTAQPTATLPAPSANAPAAASGEDLAPITLGVGFVPSVQFAPLYVGIQKGFFREEGLDVALEYGFENDYLKLVGVNDAQFMIGSGDQVVIGRSQGLPVRYVMKWYTRFPVVIMALQDAGITTPAELAGKKVGIPGPFGASYVAFRGILEAAGLDESDVTMESIGFTQAAALADGTVDAAVDYAANGPIVLAAEGIATDEILLDDYLRIPANGLITNDETLQERPDLVRAMVAATVRSIQYTLDHPDEAFDIALQYVPEAGGENSEINRAVFDSSLDFWAPQGGEAIGVSTEVEWRTAAELMHRIGLSDTVLDADELFTNEFLP